MQLYTFDILAVDGDDLRKLPLHLRKNNLAASWDDGLMASIWRPLSKARSDRSFSALPAN
jgi:ATP-dependent DNA ligase